jgi:hypothetical protein
VPLLSHRAFQFPGTASELPKSHHSAANRTVGPRATLFSLLHPCSWYCGHAQFFYHLPSVATGCPGIARTGIRDCGLARNLPSSLKLAPHYFAVMALTSVSLMSENLCLQSKSHQTSSAGAYRRRQTCAPATSLTVATLHASGLARLSRKR